MDRESLKHMVMKETYSFVIEDRNGVFDRREGFESHFEAIAAAQRVVQSTVDGDMDLTGSIFTVVITPMYTVQTW